MTTAHNPAHLLGTNTSIGQAPLKRWRAFALLAVAFFMTVVDLTIVNTALPTIGRDLHFSQTNLQWVVTHTRSRSAVFCCSAVAPRTSSAAAGS